MPVIKLQAYVELVEGCRLRYDCPGMSGESFESDRFFRAYQGKFARFVGFSTVFVGFSDYYGRAPGEYIFPDGLRVVFEGETEERALNRYHFLVVGPAMLREITPDLNPWGQRVGDLPEKEHFLPLDVVRYADDLLKLNLRVMSVSVNSNTGAASYQLVGTAKDVPYEHLRLVNRGPVSLLRGGVSSHGEIERALEDFDNLLDFWTKYGRGQMLKRAQRPRDLDEARHRVASGSAVFIDDHQGRLYDGGRPVIDLYDVNVLARPYEAHIRALTLEFWIKELARQSALQKEKIQR